MAGSVSGGWRAGRGGHHTANRDGIVICHMRRQFGKQPSLVRRMPAGLIAQAFGVCPSDFGPHKN